MARPWHRLSYHLISEVTIESVGRNNKRKNTCVWCTWRLSLNRKMNQPIFFHWLEVIQLKQHLKICSLTAYFAWAWWASLNLSKINLKNLTFQIPKRKQQKSKHKSRVAKFHPPNFTFFETFQWKTSGLRTLFRFHPSRPQIPSPQNLGSFVLRIWRHPNLPDMKPTKNWPNIIGKHGKHTEFYGGWWFETQRNWNILCQTGSNLMNIFFPKDPLDRICFPTASSWIREFPY